MVNEKVFEFLNKKGFADRIHERKETIGAVGWRDVCKGWEEE